MKRGVWIAVALLVGVAAAALARETRIPTHAKTLPRGTDWAVHGSWAVLPEPPLRYWELRLGAERLCLLDLDGDGEVLRPYVDGWVLPEERTILPVTPLLPLGDRVWRLTPAPRDAVLAEEIPVGAFSPWMESLRAINAARAKAGLALVFLEESACARAERHVAYLEAHFSNGAMPHDPHMEMEHLPLFSEEGAAAGMSSCLGYLCDPTETIRDYFRPLVVDTSVGQLYHRLTILDPAAEAVGIAAGRQWGCVYVRRGEALAGSAAGHYPLRYPERGQEEVPQMFAAPEVPMPLPAGAIWFECGYPVTLTFGAPAAIEAVEARILRLPGGPGPLGAPSGNAPRPGGAPQDVPCHVSWPGNPANASRSENKNTIALIPRARLACGARYRVEIRCRRDGVPVEEAWEFVTHREELTLPRIEVK